MDDVIVGVHARYDVIVDVHARYDVIVVVRARYDVIVGVHARYDVIVGAHNEGVGESASRGASNHSRHATADDGQDDRAADARYGRDTRQTGEVGQGRNIWMERLGEGEVGRRKEVG